MVCTIGQSIKYSETNFVCNINADASSSFMYPIVVDD